MAWINYARATIGGRLVDQPCAGVDAAGNTTCKFRLAVNRGAERSLFFIKSSGTTAERISTKYAKGSNILLDCLIHNRGLTQTDGREVLSVEFEAVAEYTVDTRDEYEELLEGTGDGTAEIQRMAWE